MDPIGNRLKHITNELKEYVETKVELMVLNIGDKVTFLIGQSVQQLMGYTVLLIGLLFGLVSLAIFLGDVFDNLALGYLVVAAPFLIAGIVMVVIKPQNVARLIQAKIMEELLDKIEEKEEEELKQLTTTEIQKEEIRRNG